MKIKQGWNPGKSFEWGKTFWSRKFFARLRPRGDNGRWGYMDLLKGIKNQITFEDDKYNNKFWSSLASARDLVLIMFFSSSWRFSPGSDSDHCWKVDGSWLQWTYRPLVVDLVQDVASTKKTLFYVCLP